MLYWEHQLPITFQILHYNVTLITILFTLTNSNKQLPWSNVKAYLRLMYDHFVKLKFQSWSTVENVKDAKLFTFLVLPLYWISENEYQSVFGFTFFSLDFGCLSFRLLTTNKTVSQRSHKAFIYSQLFCDTLGYKRWQRGQNLPYAVSYLPSPDSRSCLSCSGPCNEGDSKHILVFSLRNP